MLKAIVSITLQFTAFRSFNRRVPANYEPKVPIVAPLSICGQDKHYHSGDIFYIKKDFVNCYRDAMKYNASAILLDESIWGNHVFDYDIVMVKPNESIELYLESPLLLDVEIAPDPTPSIFQGWEDLFYCVSIATYVSIFLMVLVKLVRKFTSIKLKRDYIPVSKYNLDVTDDVCSICLDEFTKGVSIRTTKCKHIYHEKCLDKWINDERQDIKCPNCNTPLFN